MKKIAAFLLSTTVIASVTPSYAGVYEPDPAQNQPFFWTDLENNRSSGSDTGADNHTVQTDDRVKPGARSGHVADMPKSTSPETSSPRTKTSKTVTDAPRDSGAFPNTVNSASDPHTTEPRNPLMRNYPEKDAPRFKTPDHGTSRYLKEDCNGNPNAPAAWTTNMPPKPAADQGKTTDPEMKRRGVMAGDDGVLEAIQDNPCARIYRRGGPNNASVNEYTDPRDIRRANSLEDRRIPVHEVGRYAPKGSGLWYRDQNNPYIDPARSWDVKRGTMLSHLLTEWGKTAGYNVVWRSKDDFVIQTDVVIRGTFPEAAGQVLEAFADANPPISGDFYTSSHTLVVNSANEFDGR